MNLGGRCRDPVTAGVPACFNGLRAPRADESWWGYRGAGFYPAGRLKIGLPHPCTFPQFAAAFESGCFSRRKEEHPVKVTILCGGLGTRLREETEFRPKPMVEIGGRPILWHIMKMYAHHGFHDFVL